MSCNDDVPPIKRSDLLAAFAEIEKQSLRPTRLLMNERDYNDIAGQQCTRCRGYFSRELAEHPLEACDLEIARQIMES